MKFDRSDRRQRRKMRDLKRWSAAPETDSHKQWVSRRQQDDFEEYARRRAPSWASVIDK